MGWRFQRRKQLLPGVRANIGKRVFENAFGYPAETPFDGGVVIWK